MRSSGRCCHSAFATSSKVFLFSRRHSLPCCVAMPDKAVSASKKRAMIVSTACSSWAFSLERVYVGKAERETEREREREREKRERERVCVCVCV